MASRKAWRGKIGMVFVAFRALPANYHIVVIMLRDR